MSKWFELTQQSSNIEKLSKYAAFWIQSACITYVGQPQIHMILQRRNYEPVRNRITKNPTWDCC